MHLPAAVFISAITIIFASCSLFVYGLCYTISATETPFHMTLRTVSASWSAATHAVVLFTADDSVSIVPVKRIIEENVQVQQPCSVRWTNDTIYEGTLQAIGTHMEMKEILASMEEKSGDSVSEADEDHSDAPGQQKRKKITDAESSETVGVSDNEEDLIKLGEKKRKTVTSVASKNKAKQKEARQSNQKMLEEVLSETSSREKLGYTKFEQSVLEALKNIERHLCDRSSVRSVQSTSGCDQQLRSASCSPLTRTPKEQHRISVPTYKYESIEESSSTPPHLTHQFTGDKGCWLGDPNSHINEGKKIWIVDGDEKKVSIAESISDTPAKLAVALLSALFSKEELAAGNCTPAPSRQTLNPVIIKGIRMHLMYKHPVPSSTEEEARWKKIIHINMNSKCRNVRASLKGNSKSSDIV